MQEAGLYIHIPFCQSKCHYCAFNSRPGSRAQADGYLQVLQQQLSRLARQPEVADYQFSTVFVGGGTPTLASPGALVDLLNHCQQAFTIAQGAEISLEAHPNSVRPADLQSLVKAGYNRLSLGVQSFQDGLLHDLGRSHSAQQARESVAWARQAGFSNLNLDLIYGLPGQSSALWQRDLELALELAPEHLALYELTIEEDSLFGRQSPQLPHEDEVADMEELSLALLAGAYQRYEVSNYSRPGRQCLHNLNYWHNGDYLGVGAGAVSCLAGCRSKEEVDVARYIVLVEEERSTRVDEEVLGPEERFRETVVMGLRLVEGIAISHLEQRFALSLLDVYGNLISELTGKGLLRTSGDRLRLPPAVMPVANQVLAQLV